MPPVGPITRARATLGVEATSGMPDARKGWDARPVRVRQLVAVSGLGQEELAARLGIGVRSLRRYMDDDAPESQRIGYGDLCNLERIAAYRLRSAAAAEGRRRRRDTGGIAEG